jgi:GNAT superfamily N-acetyltransferase
MSNNIPDSFYISTDKSLLDLSLIHNFLKECYWAENIPRCTLEKSINNSLCFGIYEGERQVGFARVITDFATFAYLEDVFVIAPYRGRGLGKWLIETILKHSELQNIRMWLLLTDDAHELYRRYGFQELAQPEIFMEITKTAHELYGAQEA